VFSNENRNYVFQGIGANESIFDFDISILCYAHFPKTLWKKSGQFFVLQVGCDFFHFRNKVRHFFIHILILNCNDLSPINKDSSQSFRR